MLKCALFLVLVCLALSANAQTPNVLTTLHPRPQVSFLRSKGTPFVVTNSTQIVVPDGESAGVTKALLYLERRIGEQLGDTLAVVSEKNFSGAPNAILIGSANSSLISSRLAAAVSSGEALTQPEGYVLDVASDRILIAGSDSSGLFYGVSTLAQLLVGPTTHLAIPALHILDYPDYPDRWVFSQFNLQVAASLTKLGTIEDTMAAHKLNTLMLGDFKNNVLDIVPGWYFSNVDSLHQHSSVTNVEIVPSVCDIGYSEGILFHDPNLAEGIPTTSTFYVESDTGRLITDPRVSLPNGNFESVSNGMFTGWSYYDGPNQSAFIDSTTVHSGRYSARCTNFTAGNAAGNCRFNRLLNCEPFHAYHMFVWVKTNGFAGTFQLLALGVNDKGLSEALTSTQYSVPATSNGWTRYDVTFNTLTWTKMYVYAGVWGGTAGTIWFDDFLIEDAGLQNVLRRSDIMPVVTNATTNVTYAEGRDYEPIVDSFMEQNMGNYPWHIGPTIHLTSSSSIHNGDTLLVHFSAPVTTLNDASGNGQAMVCPSEDTLYSILHDQITRVEALHHPNRYLMGHDEIRVMNWDSTCARRNLTPAQLLADNLTKCDSIIHRVDPEARNYVWSDMFDSLHNAHSNYYLVNGDLSGDWNLIPHDITIVNWNGGNMKASLSFFAGHGFSQITSPYYDVQNTDNIRAWRIAMNGVPGVRGMMYTTWSQDYSFLTPFADYAWSAGPMIVHEPLDSATVANFQQGMSLPVSADVLPDAYDPNDSITSVMLIESYTDHGITVLDSIPLSQAAPQHFVGAVTHALSSYHIRATNAQGLSRTTPDYKFGTSGNAEVKAATPRDLELYPNPASSEVRIKPAGALAKWTVSLIDNTGRTVLTAEASSPELMLSLDVLPAGTYDCVIHAGQLKEHRRLSVLK